MSKQTNGVCLLLSVTGDVSSWGLAEAQTAEIRRNSKLVWGSFLNVRSTMRVRTYACAYACVCVQCTLLCEMWVQGVVYTRPGFMHAYVRMKG